MPWIVERKRDFLVRWRDAETGKSKSRSVSWNVDGEGTGSDFDFTKEQARRRAEALAEEKRKSERAYRKPLERVTRQDQEDYPGGQRPDFIGLGDDTEDYRFENYLRRIIERDNIRDSSKATYLHSLRNHIDGTPLGRKNIRYIESEDVESFWDALSVGVGARRNIAQLLRKAFARAVRRGIIDVNPLSRSDIAVPSKKIRVRGPIRVLEPEELGALADAAASKRDRCIVLVMGYGGLRGGEVGGLTRRDIVRRNGYCELRLHQQVIRIAREKKITELKTEAGRRSVPVPCALIDEVEAYLKELPPAADGRIFHGTNGELVAVQGINNAVQRTARRAKLGPVNSHLLRHTAASLWIDDGADPESVRRALGHSDIKITLGLYGHMFSYGAAKLAESMERRIEKYRKEKDKRKH